ncbi:MAG: hypothetical protein RR806_08375 [Oscillospiraceae bacterium]
MLTDVGSVPVIQTGNGGDGFGMGGAGGLLGIILIIALLGGNGFGGLGGNNGGGIAGVDNTVWSAQQFSTLDNGIRGLAGGICDSSYALNNSIKDSAYSNAMAMQTGFSTIGNAICASTYELNNSISRGFCDTNRSIDGVNFNIERSSNAIIQSGNANTQRILDFLCCSELKEAQTKITEQGQALSEARIIGAMKPQAPIPAYIQPSPYGAYGYGHNNCNGNWA